VETRLRDLAPALVVAAAVASLSLADGGFGPETWGWATIGLIAGAVLALLGLGLPRLGRRDLAFAAALGALGGWALVSSTWSLDPGQSVIESERDLLYLAGALAVLLAARRGSVPHLLAGLLAAIVAVCIYGLSIRLFPDSVDSGGVALSTDPQAAFKLAQPLGYSNALGVLAAIGMALAFVLGARFETPARRGLAAAALPLLAVTLYLTFSRGAWLALGVGLAVSLALDPRRLGLGASLLALAPAPALAVVLASRSDGLTTRSGTLGEVQADGRRLALAVVVLSLLAAASSLALTKAAGRLRPGPRLIRAATAAVLVVGIAFVGAILVRAGGPAGVYDAFNAPPAPAKQDVGKRLFSLSGSSRSDYWRVAWGDVKDYPVLGSGAGSFQRRWLERRPAELPVRDAHSLYLETLAELGPPGLLLLLLLLAAPLAAAVRARASPLAAGAVAAYSVFLVHAAVDWDWEMPAVVLAGLASGAALLAAARRTDAAQPLSPRLLTAALAVAGAAAALALLAFAGNRALADSADALDRGDSGEAARQARRAVRWQPWASEPWRLLGEAQLAEGDLDAARGSFGKGLAKDERSWELWLDFALASEGAERRRALDRAEALNPRASEVDELREEG
jgi:O-antigen ligase